MFTPVYLKAGWIAFIIYSVPFAHSINTIPGVRVFFACWFFVFFLSFLGPSQCVL